MYIYVVAGYCHVDDISDAVFQTLRVGWEQLLTSVARNINEVENQVSVS